MAQPTPYVRSYDFSDFQVTAPAAPLPGAQVDNNFDAVRVTLDQILNNLALIQRDDGALRNQSVGYDQFKPEVQTLFTPPSQWATSTSYTARVSTVIYEGAFYQCLVTHTSGVFATDLAASKWVLIADFEAIFLDAVDTSVVLEGLNLGVPENDLATLQVVPQVSRSGDNTGLYAGLDGVEASADADRNPAVALVVRGTPGLIVYGNRNISPGNATNYRFGAPVGLNGDAPVFEVAGDTARPKVASRGAIWNELGDTIDLAVRSANGLTPFNNGAFPYTEAAGQDQFFFYGHPLAYNDGTTTKNYDGQYKSVDPIVLDGASAPNFTGTFKNINSGGGSAYVDGMRYHVLFPVASGVSPTLALNGGAAIPLTRNNDATPANNYWAAGADVTFIYRAAGPNFRADSGSGSDAGNRTVTGLVYPNFGRNWQISGRMMSDPKTTNKEGQLEFSTTRPSEIATRPRFWLSSMGAAVFAGWTTYEDGTNGFGIYNDEDYPGQLLQVGGTGALLPAPRNRRGYREAPGPVNPVVTPGWGNVSIPASDFTRMPPLSIRKATAVDEGIDFAFDYSNDQLLIVGVDRGSTLRTITAIEDNGCDVARVTTSVSHGFRDFDTVYITGTTAGSGDFADPSGAGYYDGVWSIRRISATQFDLLGSIFKNFGIGSSTAAASARTTWAKFTYTDGTWQFSNAIRMVPRVQQENMVSVTGAAAGASPIISALGVSTNIGLRLSAKGTGVVSANVPLTTDTAATSALLAADRVLTAAEVLGGIIVLDPGGSGRTVTFPAAADLVAVIPAARIRDTLTCRIINGADAAETLTLAVPASGAFDANQTAASRVIAQNNSKTCYIRLTNVTASSEAYVVYA